MRLCAAQSAWRPGDSGHFVDLLLVRNGSLLAASARNGCCGAEGCPCHLEDFPRQAVTLCLSDAGNGGATHTVPVTMNEMLLRGCTLKNTGEILGLVVYSGGETRIQQNSAETPLKYGA